MDHLSTIFAWTVAVIGALAYAITWEVCRIGCPLAAHRTERPDAVYVQPSLDPSTRYWPEHSAVRIVDGITDEERDRVRRMADRITAGQPIPEAVRESAP
jgi:hypothetical protein